MHVPDTPPLPELYITEPDAIRLRQVVERFLDGNLGPAAEALELELDRASVVPQDRVPPDVVTMRSRVRLRDCVTGKFRDVELVYPSEANASEGKISILAPMGIALLGLRKGATIGWPTPQWRHAGPEGARPAPSANPPGGARDVVVMELVEVHYQPEANGAFQL